MKNAEALWQNGRDQFNRLGEVWSGFVEPSGASPQCSGMDLLVGALAQLGEWEGNGTYLGGKVVSESDGKGDGQAWDVVSPGASASNTAAPPIQSPPATSRASRATRGFFGLW